LKFRFSAAGKQTLGAIPLSFPLKITGFEDKIAAVNSAIQIHCIMDCVRMEGKWLVFPAACKMSFSYAFGGEPVSIADSPGRWPDTGWFPAIVPFIDAGYICRGAPQILFAAPPPCL